MSERSERESIKDIQEAIRRISRYLNSMSYEAFLADTKTQDAVIRNVEIIGEATRGISSQLRTENSDIPWKSMAGMRDRLIHHYFGVNLDIVWQVGSVELPSLASALSRIAETARDDLFSQP